TLARFSLATTETYKNKAGERVDDTQWHNVVLWGNLAELAGQYLQKGKEVALEGKLKHRTYDDQQGNKRYVTEVVANEFLMLGKKGEAA
ncbi:MAG: single-stranded DNA-binding protein, partial [Tunicatimonas sp.]